MDGPVEESSAYMSPANMAGYSPGHAARLESRRESTEIGDLMGVACATPLRLDNPAGQPQTSPATAAAIQTTGYGVMLMTGWFTKRRKGLVNIPSWRRRFVVLTTTGRLLYFKTERAERHRGTVDLRQSFKFAHAHECDPLGDWPADRPVGCRLQIEAAERTLYLVTDSLKAASQWRDLIKILQRYAISPYVATISNSQPSHAAAKSPSKPLKKPLPCASSNFLRLNLLAHVDGNDRCFDCGLKGTTWVCCQLGVLLCMRCAGLHRRLQSDHEGFLCDVRSLELGEFTDTELLGLELCGGNRRGSSVLEATLDPAKRRPAESNARMLAFLKEKYIDGKWSDGGVTAMSLEKSFGVDAMSMMSFSSLDDGSQSDDDREHEPLPVLL